MDLHRLRTDLLALGLLAGTIFAGMSLISYDPVDPPATAVYPAREVAANLGGPIGAVTAHWLRTIFGMGAYFVLFTGVLADLRLFARKPLADPWLRLFGVVLMVVPLCMAARWLSPGFGGGPAVGSGGYVGAWGMALLESQFAPPGIAILLGGTFLAGLVLSTEWLALRFAWWVFLLPFRPFFGRATRAGDAELAAPQETTTYRLNQPPVPGDPARTTIPLSELEDEAADDETAKTIELPEPAVPPAPVKPSKAAKAPVSASVVPAPKKPFKVNPPAAVPKNVPVSAPRQNVTHRLPGTDLLEQPEEFPYELLAAKARIAAATLERTFQEFGLNIRVVEVDTGPVVTQFELELEAGLRLSKVSALADDLAIALRVPSVRVVAPIPGKNTVGVEVPNDKQVMVRLRELLETCPQELEKKRIPIFLGKDVSGQPLTVDLAKMPHLLIAGRTGTGKSVCLNTLILSILTTRTPDQVRLLMIDPKMVELSPYTRIPHLMHPVITDMKKAEAILAWAVDKMEERYDLLARCGVRHLDNYNKLGREEILRRLDIDETCDEADQVQDTMPYIVIIADEMADMMMTSGKDVEAHIIRLAQKSRAVGIHLVLATQKPTVDVITGLIKSNLPARIAFQVSSRVDSRVVLDEMGADKLLGNGDMLYLAPGTSHLTRAQGTYVSDDEMNKIIEFFSDQEPQYCRELAQVSAGGSKGGKTGIEALRSRDDMYEQAIEVVVREGRGSVSLLQRALGIGYGRAARLVDYMAEDGIVGDYNGSQAREVLYTPEQWYALVHGEETEEVGV